MSTIKRSRSQLNLRCPQCGSNYTQTFAMAHAQTMRITQSDDGTTIAPPEAAAKWMPGIFIGLLAGAVVMFLVPFLGSKLGIDWAANLTPLSWQSWVISIPFGVKVAWSIFWGADDYNEHFYKPEMNAWKSKAICKRCGHRFRF